MVNEGSCGTKKAIWQLAIYGGLLDFRTDFTHCILRKHLASWLGDR